MIPTSLMESHETLKRDELSRAGTETSSERDPTACVFGWKSEGTKCKDGTAASLGDPWLTTSMETPSYSLVGTSSANSLKAPGSACPQSLQIRPQATLILGRVGRQEPGGARLDRWPTEL